MNRRRLPVTTSVALALCLGTAALAAAAAPDFSAKQSVPPNILMIVIDDQNDWVGFLGGHPQVKTPRMDALAAAGTAFTNAHAQAPLCNPSRTSVFSGLRPSTTGIYGLKPGVRGSSVLRDWVMLPQYFAQHGYVTACYGKVYHDGSVPPEDQDKEFSIFGPAPAMPRPEHKFVETPSSNPLVDWGVYPPDDRDSCDWITTDNAIAQLDATPRDRPFFIATGYRLPHLPCYVSQKWFDLYPEDTLELPPVLALDRDDTPRFSWYLHWKLPEPRLGWLETHDQWKPLVRAYLASTSFVDSQIGRLLDALKTSGRGDNTIVVLWSDQGWHLGEKLVTGKNSLWDRSTRVPLIFAGPGVTGAARCAEPAELLDIYPTLIALCGLPERSGLEGQSLVPQLRNAAATREQPAITTASADNHGVRTTRWRYIRYADSSEELYDMQLDPNEWTNLAGDPNYAGIKVDLAKWLPETSAEPAPGSQWRILTYKDGIANWEGVHIDPDAPIPQD